MGDQDGGEALGLPQPEDLVLELEACQGIELAQGLIPVLLYTSDAADEL